MPAFLVSILSILGLVVQDLPIVEKILAGFGTFISTELAKIFGASAGAEAMGIVTQAEDLVTQVDTGIVDAEAWLKSQWPDVASLLAAFPGLAASLYGRYTVMADNPGVTHAIAAKVVEAAHANVRVVAPAPAAKP